MTGAGPDKVNIYQRLQWTLGNTAKHKVPLGIKEAKLQQTLSLKLFSGSGLKIPSCSSASSFAPLQSAPCRLPFPALSVHVCSCLPRDHLDFSILLVQSFHSQSPKD